MRKILSNLLLLNAICILYSCNNNTPVIVKNTKIIQSQNHNQIYSTQSALIGIWKLPDEENSTFQIYVDSIYYTDQGQLFKYNIKGDTIYIFYDEWIDTSVYKIIGNKLIFIGETSIDTFERFSE